MVTDIFKINTAEKKKIQTIQQVSGKATHLKIAKKHAVMILNAQHLHSEIRNGLAQRCASCISKMNVHYLITQNGAYSSKK